MGRLVRCSLLAQVVEPVRAQTYSLRQRLVASLPHDVTSLVHAYILVHLYLAASFCPIYRLLHTFSSVHASAVAHIHH